MTTDADLAYLELPADSRMEVRLPSLLKAHAEMVAATRSENLSKLVVEALAEKVSAELASARVWKLTVPEQVQLLHILGSKRRRSAGMSKARRRAHRLFGTRGPR